MTYCTEIKETLTGTTKNYLCELVSLQKHYGILKYNIDKAWKVGGHLIPENSKTLAFYWPDRNYNLYWFMGANNETLFYYFNVGDNFELSPTEFKWRDLTIDLVVSNKGSFQVLDEEELPDDISEELLNKIQITIKYLFEDYQSIIEEAKELLEKNMEQISGSFPDTL